jgi:hypothetical protein
MRDALRANPDALGDAFHQLFMGRDTDEAEAAAGILGLFIDQEILHRQGLKRS